MDRVRMLRLCWKPAVFILCLMPLFIIGAKLYGVGGNLGANPVETLQDHFGQWGLRFILITLSVTPLRKISSWMWLVRFRRMLGLFGFFYVLMHFMVWLLLDQHLLLPAILEDIVKRPFITLGMLSLVMLTALAATSTMAARRRLGRRWQILHNAIYLIAILGVWHYWWQVKKDITEPFEYALVLTAVLGYRLWDRRKQRSHLKHKVSAPSSTEAA